VAARRTNTPREWALAIGGGLALSAGLVWVLRGGGDEAPPALLPPPPPPVIASPPPPVAAAVSAPSDLALAGLRAGPDGGMAIVVAGGKQYLLRPGRALPGGIKLLRVDPGRAILAGPSGEMVLAFADAAPAMAGPSAPPGGDPTPWRLALSPLREQGRLVGWRLNSLAGLPALARAGLKPGDVLLSANGAELISEEKVMELPQELAANGRLQIVYRRGNAQREAVVTP
jgi:membrane-associated protease RseP (regulator of RpoE activity)